MQIYLKSIKNEMKMSLKDKHLADGVSRFVITADTESLLAAPCNSANVMFFHSKLNLHNFTFYDLHSKKVMNYLWSEINGEIEASNFTGWYIDYITDLVESNPKVKVVNRCSVLSSALLSFAVTRQITIFQKFLEVVHTHMECDSVH